MDLISSPSRVVRDTLVLTSALNHAPGAVSLPTLFSVVTFVDDTLDTEVDSCPSTVEAAFREVHFDPLRPLELRSQYGARPSSFVHLMNERRTFRSPTTLLFILKSPWKIQIYYLVHAHF
jgi:hypothetical protein